MSRGQAFTNPREIDIKAIVACYNSQDDFVYVVEASKVKRFNLSTVHGMSQKDIRKNMSTLYTDFMTISPALTLPEKYVK